jgi:hypothetical protein
LSATPENSDQPSQWSSELFRDEAAGGAGNIDRGLIGHVPIVAMLLITQGLLELGFGCCGFAFLAFAYWGTPKELVELRPLGVMWACVSVPAVVTGVVRMVAGVFNLRYKRRVLGITALGLGLLTMLTCYCAPTGVALAVYGLIVYVNEPVVLAFRMGDAGRPISEIRNAYLTRG